MASKDAIEVVSAVLGHSLFRVKRSQRTWNYKAQQEVELMVLAIGDSIVSAVVRLSDMSATISFPDEQSHNAPKQIKELIENAVAEVSLMNERIISFHIEAFSLDAPKLINRIFVFETENGLEWGTTREEYGEIEPFMSIAIPCP